MLDLRALIDRAGAGKLSERLRTALAGRFGTAEETGNGEPNGERSLPWWLWRPNTARTLVTATAEGSDLRIVTTSNDRVIGWAALPFEDRLIRTGVIADSARFGDTVAAAFDRLHLSRRRVVWAIPGYHAVIRLLELPNLQGATLEQAVAEEAERVMGISVDDNYLFWQRLTGRVRRRYVFVLAVPKNVVLTTIEALDAAEIRPLAMDLKPLALARAVGHGDAIIANLEESSLDVILVADQVPVLMRSVPLLGGSLTRDAAQARLVEEIERTLIYYEDANPDTPLDLNTPIFLSGMLASGIALAERLRAVTHHPIGRPSPGLTVPSDFPVGDYLVNVGLALKQF